VTKILPSPLGYFELAPGIDEPRKGLPGLLAYQPSTGKSWRKINGEWQPIGETRQS